MRLVWIVAVVGIVLDQATKEWAVRRLQGAEAIEVVPGVLSFTYVLNPGAAFGMGTNSTLIISCLAIVITAVVLFLSRKVDDPWWGLGFGLLLAGAVGNLIDRIFRPPEPLRGHVIDFLRFDFIEFPVFNVADSAITVAAVVIIVQAFRGVDIDGSSTKDRADDD